jgi:hypothetical protein
MLRPIGSVISFLLAGLKINRPVRLDMGKTGQGDGLAEAAGAGRRATMT